MSGDNIQSNQINEQPKTTIMTCEKCGNIMVQTGAKCWYCPVCGHAHGSCDLQH